MTFSSLASSAHFQLAYVVVEVTDRRESESRFLIILQAKFLATYSSKWEEPAFAKEEESTPEAHGIPGSQAFFFFIYFY